MKRSVLILICLFVAVVSSFGQATGVFGRLISDSSLSKDFRFRSLPSYSIYNALTSITAGDRNLSAPPGTTAQRPSVPAGKYIIRFNLDSNALELGDPTQTWKTIGASGGSAGMDTSSISNFHLKVRSLFSATAPLQYNAVTGRFSMPQASAGSAGYLASADWVVFNSRLPDPGSNGLVARTAAGSTAARQLVAGSSNISLSNPDGVAGNPTIDLNDTLALRQLKLDFIPSNGSLADSAVYLNRATGNLEIRRVSSSSGGGNGIVANGLLNTNDTTVLGGALDRNTYIVTKNQRRSATEPGNYALFITNTGKDSSAWPVMGNVDNTYERSNIFLSKMFYNNDTLPRLYGGLLQGLNRTKFDPGQSRFKNPATPILLPNAGVYMVSQLFPPDTAYWESTPYGGTASAFDGDIGIGGTNKFNLNIISSPSTPNYPVVVSRMGMDFAREASAIKREIRGTGVATYISDWRSHQGAITAGTTEYGSYINRFIGYHAYGPLYTFPSATKEKILAVSTLDTSIGFYAHPQWGSNNEVRNGYGFVSAGTGDYNFMAGRLRVGGTMPSADNIQTYRMEINGSSMFRDSVNIIATTNSGRRLLYVDNTTLGSTSPVRFSATYTPLIISTNASNGFPEIRFKNHLDQHLGGVGVRPQDKETYLISDSGAITFRTGPISTYKMHITLDGRVSVGEGPIPGLFPQRFFVDGSIGAHHDSSQLVSAITSQDIMLWDTISNDFKRIKSIDLLGETFSATNGITKTGGQFKLGGGIVETTTFTGTATDDRFVFTGVPPSFGAFLDIGVTPLNGGITNAYGIRVSSSIAAGSAIRGDATGSVSTGVWGIASGSATTGVEGNISTPTEPGGFQTVGVQGVSQTPTALAVRAHGVFANGTTPTGPVALLDIYRSGQNDAANGFGSSYTYTFPAWNSLGQPSGDPRKSIFLDGIMTTLIGPGTTSEFRIRAYGDSVLKEVFRASGKGNIAFPDYINTQWDVGDLTDYKLAVINTTNGQIRKAPISALTATVNLGGTAAPTQFNVSNTAGTGVIIPAGDPVNASLLLGSDLARIRQNFYDLNGTGVGDTLRVFVDDSTSVTKRLRLIAGTGISITPNHTAGQLEYTVTSTSPGSVSSFSFSDGNGFDGTVTNSTTTPSLSLTTTLSANSVPVVTSGGALTQDANFTFNPATDELFVPTVRAPTGTDLTLRAATSQKISFVTSAVERVAINTTGAIVFNTGSDSYVFPSTRGTDGQVLSTNSSGNLSWTTVSGGGGSITNSGSGFRPIISNGTSSRTFFGNTTITIDSSSNTNGLTWKVDTTTTIATKAYANNLANTYDTTVIAHKGTGQYTLFASGDSLYGKRINITGGTISTESDSTIRIDVSTITGFKSASSNSFKVSTYNATGTVSGNDYICLVDAGSASVTLTLPAASASFASSMGKQFVFKRIDANGGNTVTVQRAGSDTIDGGTNFTMAVGETKKSTATSTTTWIVHN